MHYFIVYIYSAVLFKSSNKLQALHPKNKRIFHLYFGYRINITVKLRFLNIQAFILKTITHVDSCHRCARVFQPVSL